MSYRSRHIIGAPSGNASTALGSPTACLNIADVQRSRLGAQGAAQLADSDAPKFGSALSSRVFDALSATDQHIVLHSRYLAPIVLKRLHHYPRAFDAVLYACDMLPEMARLSEIAARSGVNPVSFSRFFGEKIGMTFSAVMKVLRIELAVRALEKGECAIEILACLSGYGSACSFTRAFRDVVGTTPSAYRREMLMHQPARVSRSSRRTA